jgi:hypothetical protein
MEGEWPLHIPTALLGRTICVVASRSRFVSKRILTSSEIEPRFSFRLGLVSLLSELRMPLYGEDTWLELSPILGVRVL